jgi:hypothetical protein
MTKTWINEIINVEQRPRLGPFISCFYVGMDLHVYIKREKYLSWV